MEVTHDLERTGRVVRRILTLIVPTSPTRAQLQKTSLVLSNNRAGERTNKKHRPTCEHRHTNWESSHWPRWPLAQRSFQQSHLHLHRVLLQYQARWTNHHYASTQEDKRTIHRSCRSQTKVHFNVSYGLIGYTVMVYQFHLLGAIRSTRLTTSTDAAGVFAHFLPSVEVSFKRCENIVIFGRA